jgi:hypothetical protein
MMDWSGVGLENNEIGVAGGYGCGVNGLVTHVLGEIMRSARLCEKCPRGWLAHEILRSS